MKVKKLINFRYNKDPYIQLHFHYNYVVQTSLGREVNFFSTLAMIRQDKELDGDLWSFYGPDINSGKCTTALKAYFALIEEVKKYFKNKLK